MSYRTVTLKRVYESIVRLRGMDPDASRLSTAQRLQVAELISDRLRTAWEAEMWPELLVTERRQYAPDYDVSETCALGAVRFFEDDDGNQGYFESLQDANTGNEPDFSAATAWWQEVGEDFVTKIDYQQSWETGVIGHVDVKRGIFSADPRLRIDARPLNGCRIIDGGALLVADTHLDVLRPWVVYRPPSPEVSLQPHNLALQYAVGSVVYDEVTGDCYKALEANTNTALTNTTVWSRVLIPYIFAEYIKHGVVSDLTMEDQGRLRSEARAQEELDRVRDVQLEQRGEVRKITFRRRIA